MELLHFALSHRNNMSSTIANEWVLSSNCELTKWPPFCKQHFHFQMVLEWWLWYIYSNFTKVCSWVSNWQCVAIDLGDGSIPNRWQATTETNIGKDVWRICFPWCPYELESLLDSGKAILTFVPSYYSHHYSYRVCRFSGALTKTSSWDIAATSRG